MYALSRTTCIGLTSTQVPWRESLLYIPSLCKHWDPHKCYSVTSQAIVLQFLNVFIVNRVLKLVCKSGIPLKKTALNPDTTGKGSQEKAVSACCWNKSSYIFTTSVLIITCHFHPLKPQVHQVLDFRFNIPRNMYGLEYHYGHLI